jgi:cyclopropane fatty-acyl-phospholipid synthase-like methyltransferase
MAGVLDQLLRPQKRAVVHCISRMNPKALELQTAKEILAEVFRVMLSDVDEMIQNRFEAHLDEAHYEEDELWPREFWLER